MDQEQMSERCPGAALLGVATLESYRLGFTIFSPTRQCGCADIITSDSDSVYGLLYQVTPKHIELLDGFEGHPRHYRRTEVTIKINGESASAYTYEVIHKSEGLKPSKHYLGLIRDAATLHGFPQSYQDKLHKIKTID
jgi:hypothetical protein